MKITRIFFVFLTLVQYTAPLKSHIIWLNDTDLITQPTKVPDIPSKVIFHGQQGICYEVHGGYRCVDGQIEVGPGQGASAGFSYDRFNRLRYREVDAQGAITNYCEASFDKKLLTGGEAHIHLKKGCNIQTGIRVLDLLHLLLLKIMAMLIQSGQLNVNKEGGKSNA